MPTLNWLRTEFSYGYDSGDILSLVPGKVRRSEEWRSGGSYRRVFKKAVLPYLRPDSKVLELGPGKGSWTRAILKFIPQGELHTVDIQDVAQWLQAETYAGRLVCHQVRDNTFEGLPDGYFDFFWSFGVLCHNEGHSILEILRYARRAMKQGALSVHQYGDWRKLDQFGWSRGGVPERFRTQRDQDIWWPRNDQDLMAKLATEAGWEVLCADLDLLRRDSLILLRNT
jgi:SAM-dependent methyltransferase